MRIFSSVLSHHVTLSSCCHMSFYYWVKCVFGPCTILKFWKWSLLETLNHFGPHAFKTNGFSPYF